MTATITRLTGQALLDYIVANPLQSHTESCRGAGYLKEFKDGSQGCAFTDYFEAILQARKDNGEYQAPTSGADWYESLTEQDSELYDMIEDRCPEFTKLDADMCQEFMDELSDVGITTAQQFEDAYFYQTDEYNAESAFAQYYAEEIACLAKESFLIVDYQATWDCHLSYDFSTIEFDGETYFFHKNF